MTVIDEDTRSSIADLINFQAGGGTCLGRALEKGLEVRICIDSVLTYMA